MVPQEEEEVLPWFLEKSRIMLDRNPSSLTQCRHSVLYFHALENLLLIIGYEIMWFEVFFLYSKRD